MSKEYRLNDDEILTFIMNGYHLLEVDFPDGFNDKVCKELEKLEENPLDEIVTKVPLLNQVYEHPVVNGALKSILGDDYQLSGHRHWHCKPPNSPSMNWHQDSVNQRNVTEVWNCLALYYPQDVKPNMGPTIVCPGSHFRNAPTDMMANYFHICGQEALTVKAGTVAITHYDIWHTAAKNKSNRQRHMIKMPVHRKTVPQSPSWSHNPSYAKQLISGGGQGALSSPITSHIAVPTAQTEHYKQRRLRKLLWDWMCGNN
jgi:hypothetical protein